MPHSTKPIPRPVPTPRLAERLDISVNPPNFECKHIKITPLAKTFCCEVAGVDFSNPIPPEVFSEIYKAWAQYGVIIFRKTQLNDESHIAFSAMFGELDSIRMYIDDKDSTRKLRTGHFELFDVSNLDANNNILSAEDRRAKYNKGNNLFHIDSSFGARRASYSLLLAHQLPPPGTGGETDFADIRTAYDDLTPEMKLKLEGVVCEHSLWHSRKIAYPEYEASDFEKRIKPPVKHDLIQLHEPSGRKSLYVSAHAASIVGEPQQESLDLIWDLIEHASQPKYTVKAEWFNPGDLVCWDNLAVMHRGNPGEFETKYKRDMRRCTVHDAARNAWGYNQA